MKRKSQKKNNLEIKLEENFKTLSQFWEEKLKDKKLMAFNTARRAIYVDDRTVSTPTLIVLMDALGFARSEIVKELKEVRKDTTYWRLVEPAGGVEGDLSGVERQVIDDLRRMKAENEKFHNAFVTLIRSFSGVSAFHLADPENSPLHVLAGAKIGESKKEEFQGIVELFLDARPEKLKELKVEVNARNEHGATPFLCACMAGNEEIALTLIGDDRVDVRATDKDGVTALHYVEKLRLGRVAEALKKKDPEYVLDYWVTKSG